MYFIRSSLQKGRKRYLAVLIIPIYASKLIKKPRNLFQNPGMPFFILIFYTNPYYRRKAVYIYRQVFWLSDHPNNCVFPFRINGIVTLMQFSSPITAAGPHPILTGFPFHPNQIGEPVGYVKLNSYFTLLLCLTKIFLSLFVNNFFEKIYCFNNLHKNFIFRFQ